MKPSPPPHYSPANKQMEEILPLLLFLSFSPPPQLCVCVCFLCSWADTYAWVRHATGREYAVPSRLFCEGKGSLVLYATGRPSRWPPTKGKKKRNEGTVVVVEEKKGRTGKVTRLVRIHWRHTQKEKKMLLLQYSVYRAKVYVRLSLSLRNQLWRVPSWRALPSDTLLFSLLSLDCQRKETFSIPFLFFSGSLVHTQTRRGENHINKKKEEESNGREEKAKATARSTIKKRLFFFFNREKKEDVLYEERKKRSWNVV